MHPEPPPSRRGFILATTLLVMTLLTVMLTAGFVMISAEFRATNGSFSYARALNLAQSGLHSYFAASHSLGSGYDSTGYAMPGGYAIVVARRLRDSTGTTRPMWIVYSTGVDTSRNLSNSGGGKRTVAELAYLPELLPARAAMVSANGVNVTGNGNNPLSGTNANLGSAMIPSCTTPSNPTDDTAAATLPAGNDATGGNGSNPTGTTEHLASTTAITDSTSIDWARVLAGDLYPDHTNSLPADCSGGIALCPYESYYYTGNVTIPGSAGSAKRGLLISTGDVTLNNGAHWDGIIIAGGKLTANVNNYIVHGMVVTGMNCATGSCPAANNNLKRGGTIQWDWCYARAAISGFSGLVPYSGTYFDAFKVY